MSTLPPPPPPPAAAWPPPAPRPVPPPPVHPADDLDDIERQAATVKDGPAVVDAPPPQPFNRDLHKRYRALVARCAACEAGDNHLHLVELTPVRGDAAWARWMEHPDQPNREAWKDLPVRTELNVRVGVVRQ